MKRLLSTLLAAGFAILPLQADPGTVLGYLEPSQSIEMTTAETGIIGKIFVKEGQAVRAGTPLLSLDNSVLEAQLEIARVQAESTAAIDVAQADLEVANDRYEKLSRLRSSGTAHASEVTRAEAERKKANGQLSIANEEKRIAQYRVEEIEAQIERRILRSPIDGVVLEVNREVAEISSSGSPQDSRKPLVKVARIDLLKLVVHVPAGLMEYAEEGREVPVRVLQQSSLSLDRENSAIDTTGTIEFVSPAIDPSSETLRTRVVVENPEMKLKSGSHALVVFE
ncbi:MAG: efflux RND transporter periplasmic adaptor subunit [Verrucomicrobiota bacterium]